jgi:hypothetical protein
MPDVINTFPSSSPIREDCPNDGRLDSADGPALTRRGPATGKLADET